MFTPARFSSLFYASLASLAFAATACSGVATGTDGTSGTSGSSGRSAIGDPASEQTQSGGTNSSGGTSGSLGTPTTGKRFFITSQTYDGNLKAKGGADALCQVAADGAVLGGTFKAYLGTSSLPPANGLAEGGPWYLLQDGGKLGFKAFNNKANLSTTPLVSLDTDERGRDVPYDTMQVWTGVSGDDCNGWTTNGYADRGGAGRSHTSADEWRDSGNNACNLKAHLYCVEQ